MTFWQSLKQTYSGSTAFIMAMPLLALFPVLFEMMQHVVEVHIGLYDSVAAAQAHEHDPLRMGFGLVKVAALILPSYWVMRFLAWRDPARATTFDPAAVRLFAGVFAFQIALAVLQLFLLPQIGWVLLVSGVIGQIVGMLLLAWCVAAPLGNPALGPRRSTAIMVRQLPWTFVFSLAAILPLMVPHYALAFLAIKGPPAMLWPGMVLDSLLVGWLDVVLLASSYVAALRAAGKAGVRLDAASVDASDRAFGTFPAKAGAR